MNDNQYHIDPIWDYGDKGIDVDSALRFGCVGCICYFAMLLAVLFLFVLCTVSCSPLVAERIVSKTDTCYIQKQQRDSIYVHDSTYIHEYQRQDTLIIERVRWRTLWRERLLRDTAYVARRDTIFVAGKPQRTNVLTGWQWFQVWMGRLAMVALALAVGWKVVRWRVRKILQP